MLVAVLALVLGAQIVGAQTSDEPAPDEAAPADSPERFQPFLDCVAEQGIDLPDFRAHRRDREPLGDDERAAVQAAREACGDQLPHAEDRAALRQCVTDRLAEDAVTPVRALVRTCADELGLELPRHHRRCGRQH